MTVPKFSFASTFTQGAGVSLHFPVRMTYSLPSGENPPVPLKQRSPFPVLSEPASGCGFGDRVGIRCGTAISFQPARSTCSKSVPQRSEMITRATVCMRIRSSSDICSKRRIKIPPFRFNKSDSEPWGSWRMISSCSSCRYPDRSSFQITRSTISPFVRQYA